MKSGRELISEIDSARVEPGEVMLWWLGQQGYVAKTDSTVIYIDAFLSPLPDRLIKPFLSPQEVTNASLILGTHDHADHIDRDSWPAMAQASPQAKFVVPRLLLEGLSKDLGIPRQRFIGLDDGESTEACGMKITGIAAAHEFLDRDKATGMYPHLGYVIEAAGRTFYHGGDGCVYEGLVTKLRKWRLDAVMLPINGRDAERLSKNIIGNMTYQEAADLAGAVSAGTVLPGHYDMFEFNLADVGAFARYVAVKHPDVKCIVPQYAEPFTIARR